MAQKKASHQGKHLLFHSCNANCGILSLTLYSCLDPLSYHILRLRRCLLGHTATEKLQNLVKTCSECVWGAFQPVDLQLPTCDCIVNWLTKTQSEEGVKWCQLTSFIGHWVKTPSPFSNSIDAQYIISGGTIQMSRFSSPLCLPYPFLGWLMRSRTSLQHWPLGQ